MHIKKIEITNIRNIEKLVWELPDGQDLAGWHVLIGDNGSGKTTILRAIARLLMGTSRIYPIYGNNKIKKTENTGLARLGLSYDELYDDKSLINIDEEMIQIRLISQGDNTSIHSPAGLINLHNAEYGWFSASYGSSRRFVGNKLGDISLMEDENFRTKSHLPLISEDFAFVDVQNWLITLNYKYSENEPEKTLFNRIVHFINQKGFLPHNIRLLNATPFGVIFLDADDNEVELIELASGYRSTLAIILDIIRQMSIFYPNKPLFNDDFTQVIPPGVVLIDEVDAHLHPSWQREIGRKLTALFPNIQFIVTTHSPLVCQASVKGSIFRLPTPGTGETGGMIERGSENWKRLVYGDILEAYSTDLFGENIERAPESQEILSRVSELSGLEYERRLTDTEKAELRSLMDMLPKTPINL